MSLGRSLCFWRFGGALLKIGRAAENAPHLLRAPVLSTVTLNTKSHHLFVRFYSEQSASQDSESSSSTKTSDSESDKDESSSSTSTSDSESDKDEERVAVLDAALKCVPELGWSEAALLEGAKLNNMVEEAAKEMFPRGAGELVDYFEEESNRELNDFMEKLLQEEKLQGSAMIRTSVEHKLRMLIPYIDKWPQAMAVKAFPTNMPSSLENLALLIDDIWYFAGDRSTDMNWYTKRALLAALYSSTELYMLQDKSADFKDTWKFLDCRMDEIKLVGHAVSDAEGVFTGALEFISAGFTTVMNMTGYNTKNRK